MVWISLLRITDLLYCAVLFATILLTAVFLDGYYHQTSFCTGGLQVAGMTPIVAKVCSEAKNWVIYILVVFVVATILILLTFELSKGSRKPKQKTMREYMPTT